MKHWLIAVGLVVVCSTPGLCLDPHQGAPILPEATTAVVMSAKDVNRITCPTPIQDLIFSTEKNVEGKYIGNNAFIKFKFARVGHEIEYATEKTEFFIVCGDAVYTLIATPTEKLDAVTLRLAPPKEKEIKENIGIFEAMPLDKIASKLIKEAYMGEFPSSYTVQKMMQTIDISSDLIVRITQKVTVDGMGLELYELSVRSNRSADKDIVQGLVETPEYMKIRLFETDFLKQAVARNIIAIAMTDQVLRPGQATRVFVIASKGGTL